MCLPPLMRWHRDPGDRRRGLIICGRQTTDGDTAQVGPAIAEHLTIPHAAWVAEIVDVNEKAFRSVRIWSVYLRYPRYRIRVF